MSMATWKKESTSETAISANRGTTHRSERRSRPTRKTAIPTTYAVCPLGKRGLPGQISSVLAPSVTSEAASAVAKPTILNGRARICDLPQRGASSSAAVHRGSSSSAALAQ